MGSKNRHAKDILPIILADRHEGQFVYDLFCGGGSICDKIEGNVVANDFNKYVISALKLIRDNIDCIPKNKKIFTEKEYKLVKDNIEFGGIDYGVKGYTGFALSYGGKWFGGWCRDRENKRDYVAEAYRNAVKQSRNIQNVIFTNLSYDEVILEPNSIVYCFDDKSEVLTQRGWISVKDVTTEDYCFSREPNTKKLEWVKVDSLIKYHHKGKMYKYEGKNIDLLTTPEHRLFVNKFHTRARTQNDEFLEAKDAFKSNFRFISSGGLWEGDCNNKITICGEEFNKKDFAYFLGIFLTDGSVNNKGAITINQTKPNIINKIKNILKNLNINYSIYKNRGDNKTIYIPKKYLPYFNQFYLKENRKIPKEIKESNIEVLKMLLEGIIDGDGSEGRRVHIGSKSMVDDIQEIAYKIGLSSNYQIRKPKRSYLKSEDRYIDGKKEYYVVSINSKPYLSHIHKNESYIDWDDMVYCFMIEKWHTVLVRRNGKPIWCGQCDIPYINTTKYSTNELDYERFYSWCIEKHHEGHKVFISSYYMPQDRFKCVWSKQVNSSLDKDTGSKKNIEKLFIVKDDAHF